MDCQLNKCLLIAGVTLALVSCGPQKSEEGPQEPEKTSPMMDLKKPEEVSKPMEKETPLTPHQKEELEINEDNVMNPLPG